jgi:hypothetical protein
MPTAAEQDTNTLILSTLTTIMFITTISTITLKLKLRMNMEGFYQLEIHQPLLCLRRSRLMEPDMKALVTEEQQMRDRLSRRVQAVVLLPGLPQDLAELTLIVWHMNIPLPHSPRSSASAMGQENARGTGTLTENGSANAIVHANIAVES